MPELTIVASCRVMIVRSSDLILPPKGSLSSAEPALSLISRTMRPRDLSWSETLCLLSASTCPVALAPERSIALKTYVAMGLGRHAERLCPEQAAQLLRDVGALLRQAAGDLAGADELRQRGVHRLHADVGAGLHR